MIFHLNKDPFHITQSWTPVRYMLTYCLPITVSWLKTRNCLIQYIFRSAFIFYKCLPEKSSEINRDGKLVDLDVTTLFFKLLLWDVLHVNSFFDCNKQLFVRVTKDFSLIKTSWKLQKRKHYIIKI